MKMSMIYMKGPRQQFLDRKENFKIITINTCETLLYKRYWENN